MTINLCPDRKDYYSQLNNEQDPFISCQATTAAQCIDIVDNIYVMTSIGPYKQPEDNLRRFCKYDSETMSLCVRRYGVNWDNEVDHPSEYVDILVFAINKIMGYQCAHFEPYINPQLLAADLNSGLPIQVSMWFHGISGHHVSVVGLTDQGNWIINDPYRDWLHDSPNGFNVIYTPDDLKNHLKGHGIKYSRRK